MKKILFVILNLIIYISYLNANTNVLIQNKMVSLSNITFKNEMEYNDRKYLIGYLKKDTSFKINTNIIIFQKNKRIKVYNKNNIIEGVIGKNGVLIINNNKIPLQQGKYIRFYKTGIPKRIVLGKNTMLNVGKNKILFNKKEGIEFFENGNIKEGSLFDNTIINTGKYKMKFLTGKGMGIPNIIFYSNGNVRWGYLVEPTRVLIEKNYFHIGGVELGRGVASVSFYSNGNLMSASLSSNTILKIKLKEITFKAGTKIEFTKNEKIKLKGFVESYINNKLPNQSLFGNEVIIMIKDNKIPFQKKRLTFYKNGKFMEGLLSKNFTYKKNNHNYNFKMNTLLKFNKNKNLEKTNL